MAPAVPVGVIFFMPYAFLLVFIGGGLGSITRYGLALALMPLQARFPWATLAANALACLILGAVLAAQSQGALPDSRRLLIATGFCGGFSTFSTFTADTWQLYQHGQPLAAMANIAVNLVVCFVFLGLGMMLKLRF